MEASHRRGICCGDVKTVVGESFARRQIWFFTYDFVAFDYHFLSVGFGDNPFSPEEFHSSIRVVRDGEIVYKNMRCFIWRTKTAVMVFQFVQSDLQPVEGKRLLAHIGSSRRFQRGVWSRIRGLLQ